LPAPVHVGERERQRHVLSFDPTLPSDEVAAPRRESYTAPVGQPGDYKESDIVTGALVLRSRVSQSDYYRHCD
jgi:hypothetical protein